MSRQVFTLAELAEFTQSRLIGNPDHRISNVADLESASVEDASFLANPKYEKAMLVSKAGVVFISPSIDVIDGRNFLVAEDPSRAFQRTIEAFFGDILLTGFDGVHPTAVVHEQAKVGARVKIGPKAVIDKGVVIGENTSIGAGCYIGPDTVIGSDCLIHPNAAIRERCQIGNRVVIQPGAVIGSCGFGYTTDAQGRHSKLSQVGNVIIEDDVEIGANTTIDRSRFKSTRIGRGSKIDNLVQIGHGVVIGAYNLIVAQSGVAGSSKTGNYVAIAGQVAVAGHLSIADKTMIAGKSGVSKTIAEPGKYGGIPVLPLQEYNRNSVYLRNIETYIKQIKSLEMRLDSLEKKKG